MDMKWYKYEMRVVTMKHGTKTRNYDAMSDNDACRRGDIKRLKIEDNFSEVVAYQVLSASTGEIIEKTVYPNFVDLI